MTNVRIISLGMPERFYSFMWCFSPIIGVLIGPVLGSSSDQCKSRFGRRRPFIVALVFGAIIGLSLLIFSKDIGKREYELHVSFNLLLTITRICQVHSIIFLHKREF